MPKRPAEPLHVSRALQALPAEIDDLGLLWRLGFRSALLRPVHWDEAE